MVRPRICRRVRFRPGVTYFKPAGVNRIELEEVVLTIDEYEAIRLIDLENVEQGKAGKQMKISQPTLSRLLKSARKKISEAIIKGKSIRIKGGDFKMVMPRGRGVGGRGRMGGPLAAGPGGVCKCPKCGYKESQIRGQPCMHKKCPKCGTLMKRA